MLGEAIWSALSADATLAGLVAVYGTPPLPAIFTHLPDDAPRPYVLVSGSVVSVDDDTKTTTGMELESDVLCAVDEAGSRVLLNEITAQVRGVLHRVPLVIGGATTWRTIASPAVTIDSDSSVIADIVRVSTAHQEP